jgi:hypothetical protein
MTPDAAMALRLPPDHRLARLAIAARVAGALALLVLGGAAMVDPGQAMRSYLVAFVFWLTIPLGCLAVLMIHHVTGGAWGVAVRRPLESAALTLPLMGVLFVPLVLGATHLYAWARPEVVADDPLLQHKAAYLNLPFFAVRAVFYFVAWTLVARSLARWSLRQDRGGDAAADRRLHDTSRYGLVLMGLTMTFASVDWMMSLEPHWYSTIYGVMFMGGCALSALAFVIAVAYALRDDAGVSATIGPNLFHDLGSLLLAFTMVWAYFHLSQFLIIWSANLPEEVPWYLTRTRGGWRAVAIALVVFHLVLPFFVLLSRRVKRRPATLARVALLMIAVRLLDVFWMVRPPFDAPAVHVLDAVALVAVGGLFFSAFVRQLAERPLLPLHDPSLVVAEDAA